jgi:CheY-like chemotaxis protein
MSEIKAFVFQSVDKVVKQQKASIKPAQKPVEAVVPAAAPDGPTIQTDALDNPIDTAISASAVDTKNIVVLDDDPSFTAALTRLLKSAGYTPHPVNTPDDVFPLIERVKPQLIVLDLKMPGTSGSFIAAALSQNPKTKDIPVIILSGMISVYDQTVVKKSSSNQYFLAKSAEPASWLETIAKILG